MSVCRSCGAEVRWVRMEPNGRHMPLDVEPDPERGNVVLQRNGKHAHTLPAHVAAELRAKVPEEPMYLSHFATCPQGADWRRR